MLFWGCVTLRADPIYYEVSTGKNSSDQKWHVMDRHEFEAKHPYDVYDLYTFKRLPGGTARVERQVDTPSGDWVMLLTYHYAKTGYLTKIDYEFRTFNGINIQTDDAGLTRCIRSYEVTPSGELRLNSERIEDMKTKRVVKRGFFEPTIAPWMTLKSLPIQPKTQQ